MSFPAVAVAGPLFTIETSACALIDVFTVELLFDGFVSALDDEAVAVLLATVPFGVLDATWATTVNAADAPGASEAMLQEIVAPVVQLNAGPLFCISETKLVPAGSVSVHATLDAVDGPAFATVIV